VNKILEPTIASLSQVAKEIAQGGIAVLPTETVYGLAASIEHPSAIEAIFRAKGRPNDNPLIVHIHSIEQLGKLAVDIPEAVKQLAHAFWPGPLSVVLKKSDKVSAAITAGGDTVAIRMPDHPVPLAVMAQENLCLAMPSANLFMGLSPTSAGMVGAEIVSASYAVLDGGPCSVGIESTVLDLSGEVPTILRLGVISAEEISAVLGESVKVAETIERVTEAVVTEVAGSEAGGAEVLRSPGQYKRHYAPRTKAILVNKISQNGYGLSCLRSVESPLFAGRQIFVGDTPREYAKNLYAALAELDALGIEVIEIEKPPTSEAWQAVWDRLTKATTPY
jgi:L-threonylcarbamoyladenylate synthase